MSKEKKPTKFVGISRVGEKGQIVIPKEARDMFGIAPGDSMVFLCDSKRGIAIVKASVLESVADGIFKPESGEEDAK